MIVGDRTGVVRMWDIATREQLMAFTMPSGISTISVDEDHGLLVGYGADVAYLELPAGRGMTVMHRA